jgi:hypothetical protein
MTPIASCIDLAIAIGETNMVVKADASKIDGAPGDTMESLRGPLDGCTRPLKR